MAANIVPNLNRSVALKNRVAMPALDAIYVNMMGMKVRRNPNAAGLMYDVVIDLAQYAYAGHLANMAAHGAPSVNPLVLTPVPVNVFNYVMGEYIRLVDPSLNVFNFKQIERNEAWSDRANFLADLYNWTSILNELKVRMNAHFLEGALVHLAADVTSHITAASVVHPTADGVVPSLTYRDSVKWLVELERTEPAFVKARVGTWLKNILILMKDISTQFNLHVMNLTAHAVTDDADLLTPVRGV